MMFGLKDEHAGSGKPGGTTFTKNCEEYFPISFIFWIDLISMTF